MGIEFHRRMLYKSHALRKVLTIKQIDVLQFYRGRQYPQKVRCTICYCKNYDTITTFHVKFYESAFDINKASLFVP